MSNILVSGLLNIETSLSVEEFPISYAPILYPFFGISSSISGVGYNVSKALKTLADEVSLISIVGEDEQGLRILDRLKKDQIGIKQIYSSEETHTAESVILCDKSGKRKVYCDLKNIQDLQPFSNIELTEHYDLAVACNINFSRPLLRVCKEKGIKIATDVHVLSSVFDSYNEEFMSNADILFLSNEGCLGHEANMLKEIYARYHNPIIVIGCGSEGALCYLGQEDNFIFQHSFAPNGIKNTVGAGDALFASFLHYYLKGNSIESSLEFACMFAGLKIASNGGAKGFVSEEVVLDYLKKCN